jgi:hypothetical protein
MSNNYTVRVRMVIEAEMDVEADSRAAAEEAAIADYDSVWCRAEVDSVDTHVIEENGKDV